MRGKPEEIDNAKWHTGITPADAGKTRSAYNAARNPEDHPRGCGENLFETFPRVVVHGSPPRMRGKLTNSRFILKGNRITPADAGKTARSFDFGKNK